MSKDEKTYYGTTSTHAKHIKIDHNIGDFFYYIRNYPTFIRIIEGRITDNYFLHYPDIIRIILFG